MNKLDYIEFSDGTRHTFEEISNVLGIPISNVKCRYYASKARLEDCYYGRRKVNSRVKQKYNYHGKQLYTTSPLSVNNAYLNSFGLILYFNDKYASFNPNSSILYFANS